MSKLAKLIVKNEEGEEATLDRADYIKHIEKTHEVKEHTTERGSTPAGKVIDYILKAKETGSEIHEEIRNNYGEIITIVNADYDYTETNTASAKEAAAAEKKAKEDAKAAADAEAKKKAEELALTQNQFAENVNIGLEKAKSDYAGILTDIKAKLPEGVEVIAEGHGYGVRFSKDATKETVAQTLGYLKGTADNSTFIGNQLNFWVGDTISEATERGIYATAQEAAVHIASVLSKIAGKIIEPASLDQYKRMSERTPIHLRNPRVDPSAYLLVSGMKLPKKEDKETDDAFKVRVGEFEKTREALQTKLSDGEILKRKDMVPLVNEAMIAQGLRQKPAEKPEISLIEWFKIYFFSCFGLENLVGLHAPGVAQYRDGKDIVTVTKETLEEKKALAFSHITNMTLTQTKGEDLKPADFIRGYVMKTIKVEATKNADGKPIMEDQNIKNLVYPPIWFENTKEEGEAEAGEAGDDKTDGDNAEAGTGETGDSAEGAEVNVEEPAPEVAPALPEGGEAPTGKKKGSKAAAK